MQCYLLLCKLPDGYKHLALSSIKGDVAAAHGNNLTPHTTDADFITKLELILQIKGGEYSEVQRFIKK